LTFVFDVEAPIFGESNCFGPWESMQSVISTVSIIYFMVR
jgi:hypothetical protein